MYLWLVTNQSTVDMSAWTLFWQTQICTTVILPTNMFVKGCDTTYAKLPTNIFVKGCDIKYASGSAQTTERQDIHTQRAEIVNISPIRGRSIPYIHTYLHRETCRGHSPTGHCRDKNQTRSAEKTSGNRQIRDVVVPGVPGCSGQCR